MRTRHLALRTEQAYLHWLRRYVAFHNRKHPRELGASQVEQFLTHLAVHRKVSAATAESGAAGASVCIPTRARDGAPLARQGHARLPQQTATRGLEPWGGALYGSGLRLMEGLRLRVKDVQLERGELIVRMPRAARIA